MLKLVEPYLIYIKIVAIIGLALGAYFFGTSVESRKWELVIANQKIEAAGVRLRAIARNLQKEVEDEGKSRSIDEAYNAEIANLHATLGDFNNRLRLARSRQCSGNTPAATPSNTSSVENASSGGDGGLGESDPASRLRDKVVKLQAYARAGFEFAQVCGR